MNSVHFKIQTLTDHKNRPKLKFKRKEKLINLTGNQQLISHFQKKQKGKFWMNKSLKHVPLIM